MLGEESLRGKKVGVVGLGPRTGVSLVRFLCSQGADVVVYDQKPKAKLADSLAHLKGLPYHLEAGTNQPRSLAAASLLIVSPGVPINKPFLEEARRRGTPVWSEIEFASRRILSPLLAVSGSNGKSTTAALLGHILTTWRRQVFVGGNFGTPLIEAVGKSYDFVIAEISSFQLEAVETFRPRVAILLNVRPNHLDRHGTFENYLAMKEKLFIKMIKEDRAILNSNCIGCQKAVERVRASVWQFSGQVDSKADFHLDRKKIMMRDGRSISLKGFTLLGAHNLENALAATAAAIAVGCPLDRIEQGLRSFSALPHRLQLLAKVGGISFVNDSKSTTPDATMRALEAFDAPILLLAGGRSKGASYDELGKLAKENVKQAFFFGEAAAEMGSAFTDMNAKKVESMAAAFAAATKVAKKGDIVLLSPSNASFDQFRDFEDRGEQFSALVDKYKARKKVKR